MRLGVRLGPQHELAGGPVKHGLGRRSGPRRVGHRRPDVLLLEQPLVERADGLELLVAVAQRLLRLEQLLLELGDPLAELAGRGGGDRTSSVRAPRRAGA